MSDISVDWAKSVHEVFQDAGIDLAAYVPDGGLKNLIQHCDADPGMRAVPLTNESEGPCLMAGSWLGGERSVLLMQGSGVGNCMNNFGITIAGNFPLLTIITLRGSWGEGNPWMLYQGRTVARMLDLAGFMVNMVDDAADVEEAVSVAAQTAFNASGRMAVILSQRVTGAKKFKR
ncbi:MAG: phosphonopyruvate decarboxylase [Rhodospirillales bacterium]